MNLTTLSKVKFFVHVILIGALFFIPLNTTYAEDEACMDLECVDGTLRGSVTGCPCQSDPALATVCGRVYSAHAVPMDKGDGASILKAGEPIGGVTVAFYEVVPEAPNGKSIDANTPGYITHLYASTSTTTEETDKGKYSLPMRRLGPGSLSGYVAYFCGDKLTELIKVPTYRSISDFNVHVDCDSRANFSYNPPPDLLQYVDDNTFLGCTTTVPEVSSPTGNVISVGFKKGKVSQTFDIPLEEQGYDLRFKKMNSIISVDLLNIPVPDNSPISDVADVINGVLNISIPLGSSSGALWNKDCEIQWGEKGTNPVTGQPLSLYECYKEHMSDTPFGYMDFLTRNKLHFIPWASKIEPYRTFEGRANLRYIAEDPSLPQSYLRYFADCIGSNYQREYNADDTYEPISCQILEQCNETISKDSLQNIQTTAGPFASLSSPGTWKRFCDSGFADWETEVCKDGGRIRTLKDICEDPINMRPEYLFALGSTFEPWDSSTNNDVYPKQGIRSEKWEVQETEARQPFNTGSEFVKEARPGNNSYADAIAVASDAIYDTGENSPLDPGGALSGILLQPYTINKNEGRQGSMNIKTIGPSSIPHCSVADVSGAIKERNDGLGITQDEELPKASLANLVVDNFFKGNYDKDVGKSDQVYEAPQTYHYATVEGIKRDAYLNEWEGRGNENGQEIDSNANTLSLDPFNPNFPWLGAGNPESYMMARDVWDSLLRLASGNRTIIGDDSGGKVITGGEFLRAVTSIASRTKTTKVKSFAERAEPGAWLAGSPSISTEYGDPSYMPQIEFYTDNGSKTELSTLNFEQVFPAWGEEGYPGGHACYPWHAIETEGNYCDPYNQESGPGVYPGRCVELGANKEDERYCNSPSAIACGNDIEPRGNIRTCQTRKCTAIEVEARCDCRFGAIDKGSCEYEVVERGLDCEPCEEEICLMFQQTLHPEEFLVEDTGQCGNRMICDNGNCQYIRESVTVTQRVAQCDMSVAGPYECRGDLKDLVSATKVRQGPTINGEQMPIDSLAESLNLLYYQLASPLEAMYDRFYSALGALSGDATNNQVNTDPMNYKGGPTSTNVDIPRGGAGAALTTALNYGIVRDPVWYTNDAKFEDPQMHCNGWDCTPIPVPEEIDMNKFNEFQKADDACDHRLNRLTCNSFDMEIPEDNDGDGVRDIQHVVIPRELKEILDSAAGYGNVPAALLLITMIRGGAFTSGWEYTPENIQAWSFPWCGRMPGCDDQLDSAQGPFDFVKTWFENGNPAPKRAVDAITKPGSTPRGEYASRCNLLDAAFASADMLSKSGLTGCSRWEDAALQDALCSYAWGSFDEGPNAGSCRIDRDTHDQQVTGYEEIFKRCSS